MSANPIHTTTRAVRDVRSIEDIVAIESEPYDQNVAARSLYDLLRATATLHPERPALTALAGDRSLEPLLSLTHSQLLVEVTRAANLFAALNRGREGVIAVLCPTLPEIPVALLGAQVVGVASAINYLLNIEAITDLLVAQRATVLIAPGIDRDPAIAEKVQPILERVGLEAVLHVGEVAPAKSTVSYAKALNAHRGDVLQVAAPGDRSRVCAFFHTGGTTGRPKLVRLTHGAQIHAAWSFAQVHGLDERDVAIDGFPFFHVGGTITAGLSVLAAGGHIVIPSPYALRKPEVIQNYWRIVERYRATIVSGVPTSIASLAETPIAGCDVSSVRMGLTGGAVLPKAVGERFERRTGIRLYETYGMTETAAAIAFNPGRGERLPGSVGFRAPYAETRIAKRDGTGGWTPCPPLVSGSVLVRGPQVFPGYLDPDHDRGVLVGDGWLATGDVGYFTEDQRLVLTGREKDLIIRSGHNIDPAAIEDVANGFPGVQISAAVGMPDAYAGEAPMLFAAPAPGRVVDAEALKAYLAKHVPEPPARPKRVAILESLPVTAVGKIFKPALRDLAIRENALLEIGQVFGPTVEARVEVARDDRLRTIVTIAVGSADEALRAKLTSELSKLPQTYVLRPAKKQGSADGDD
ncbi:MAG TPA: AMP-binding protein [Roseiarcus sp.]|nr:AMP-binding protein [Roseiarcus sp.]